MNNTAPSQMISKARFMQMVLPARLIPQARGYAYAPANIALAKYWGKRNPILNLPCNSSLSVSLAHLGTHTTITPARQDSVILNRQRLSVQSPFYRKVMDFVQLFRRQQHQPLCIYTVNTIPTAAGLASSASGFAALTLALNDYWQLNLPEATLSAIARLGSGSAARSLRHGFVKWAKGEQSDGSDSYARAIRSTWQVLRLAVIHIDTGCKHTSSSAGMIHTAKTSPLFPLWAETAERDLQQIEYAIANKQFSLLGQTAEANALTMHATMLAARPSLSYLMPESFALIRRVQTLRETTGAMIYCTIDAGPNIKLLYPASEQDTVNRHFPHALCINPFTKPPTQFAPLPGIPRL